MTMLIRDEYKRHLARTNGMEYHIIWSNDNLNERFNQIIGLIKEKINEHRGCVL